MGNPIDLAAPYARLLTIFQSVEKHIAPWLRHMLAMYKTRNETQKGDAKELDIVNTKSSSTGLHNKMELKLESEKLCGV